MRAQDGGLAFLGADAFDQKPATIVSGFWPEEATVEEAEYLVDGWIPTEAAVYVYGKHGSLKSFLLIHLAFCGALGWDVMGNPVREAFGSIICCGEKKSRFGKRIVAWKSAHDIDSNPAVFVRNGCPDLTSPAEVEDFIAEANAMKPEFEKRGAPLRQIALDTLSRSIRAGNVSDPTTAQLAINAIQRIIDGTACTVVSNAHVAKADGADTIKGAGEFGDSAEAYIYVERSRDAEVVTATLRKQSDGPDGLKFAFTFRPVVVGSGRHGDIMSGVIEATDVPDTPAIRRRRTDEQELVMRAVGACIDAGLEETLGNVQGIPQGTKGVRRSHVKERAITLGYADEDEKPETVRRSLNRVLKQLIGRKELFGGGNYVWTP